jgi:hypothetical protein
LIHFTQNVPKVAVIQAVFLPKPSGRSSVIGSLGLAVILKKRRRGFCMNRQKGSKNPRSSVKSCAGQEHVEQKICRGAAELCLHFFWFPLYLGIAAMYNIRLTRTSSVKSVQSVYERFFVTPIPREPSY